MREKWSILHHGQSQLVKGFCKGLCPNQFLCFLDCCFMEADCFKLASLTNAHEIVLET